jgi:hypothetical protein
MVIVNASSRSLLEALLTEVLANWRICDESPAPPFSSFAIIDSPRIRFLPNCFFPVFAMNVSARVFFGELGLSKSPQVVHTVRTPGWTCGRISSQGTEKQGACQGSAEITFAQAIEAQARFKNEMPRNMTTVENCRSQFQQLLNSSYSSQQPLPTVVRLGALLSHVHHVSASLEANFIHQTFHQVDAAAMHRPELLRCGRVRQLGAAKSRSFVPDHNGNFLIGHTAATDVNMFARIFMIAVNDAICQGFAQGDFNVNFVPRNTLAFLYEGHELIHEG